MRWTKLPAWAAHMLVLENGQVKTQGSVAEVFANIEQPMWVGEDMGAWLQGTCDRAPRRLAFVPRGF